MGARSKRAQLVRAAGDFDVARLAAALFQPRDGQTTIDSWSLEEIFEAREEQMLGQFVRPSRMVEQMRTDDALFVAYKNRLAPQRSIPIAMAPAPGARGMMIASEGEALFGANGVAVTPGTISNIHGCLVNHGIAFGVNVMTPREDGSRVDIEHHYWPIEYVRWDPVFRVFKARADPNSVQPGDLHTNDAPYNQYGFVGGYWLPVVHGDGRWVIYSNQENLPFRSEDASLLPAALVWARHAFASRDWARGSKAHGSAKVIGELPAGVPLQGPGGELSSEANSFIELLKSIARDNAPAGIRPAGSKTDFLTNTSTAWQVWSELVTNAEKAAARIYLGTDGTLGTQGGAPGVDIGELFGVAKTLVKGDLECITRGIDTGVIQPWCAVNFGDSRLAPSRRYVLPNDEEEATSDAYAKRNAAFYAVLVAGKNAGITLTPTYIIKLAEDYRVRVPEFVAPAPAPAAPAPSTTMRLDYDPGEKRDQDGKWGPGGSSGSPKPKDGEKSPKQDDGASGSPSDKSGDAAKAEHAETKAKEAATYFKADKAKLQRVHDYTDSRAKDGYRSINASLRQGKPSEAALKLIDDMKEAPKFAGEVHRSAVVPKEYAQELKDLAGVPGTAVKSNSFWSSSRSEKVARSFATPGDKKDGTARVLMHIQTKNGVSLENVSRIKGEQEVVIPPGLRFKVTKAERKGDVLHVHLEEKAA